MESANCKDKIIVPTKFTLQVFVRGIHRNVVSRIHLHFGTCLKISLWNPGTYRHKIVLLSSAQFGLVMYNVLVAKVWTCLNLVWKVRTCQIFVAKVWTWVWDLDPGSTLLVPLQILFYQKCFLTFVSRLLRFPIIINPFCIDKAST